MDAAITSILEDAVGSERFLGISCIAIDKHGDKLFSAACGYENFRRDNAMSTRTAGWLVSLSKPMTAIAVMLLVERGLVGLDDDGTHILPELRRKEVLTAFDASTGGGQYTPVSATITLRRLLSHSAGFSYGPMHPVLFEWAKAHDQTMQQFYGDFAKDWDSPLVFQPGSDWAYSTGLDWAGKVVEKISNMSLEDFMEENIWSPLGMRDTTFHPEKCDNYKLMEMGTRAVPGAPLAPCGLIYPIPAVNEAGGAGIFSTCDDYSKLLGALLRDDCPILKKETIDELLAPQLSPQSKNCLANSRAAGFPLPEIPLQVRADFTLAGLYLEDAMPGGRASGTVTWDGMCSPQWLLDRTTGVALVLFVQIMAGDSDTKALWLDVEQKLYELLRS